MASCKMGARSVASEFSSVKTRNSLIAALVGVSIRPINSATSAMSRGAACTMSEFER